MFSGRCEAEIENQETESLQAAAGGRLEGEPLPESPPVASPPSPTPPRCSSSWRGSCPPPGLWVCGGNLIQSLYVWSLLKSIWCALHDYGTIYVIPMVDIVVWDDTCYAFTVVLRLYGLSYFGNTSMIHVMILSMHNALFTYVMRCLTTLSVGRWERCENTYNL